MIAVGDAVWLGAIIAAVIIAALVLGRSISAKIGSMSVVVNETKATAESINQATNMRRPGAPTISEQVASTAARVDDIHASVETLTVTMNRGMADVNKAVDSLDQRLAALVVRVSNLEIAGAPSPQPQESAA